MKFKKIELHAFRAYKDKEFATFDFTLPDNKIANFISIYAPNGFGKTSFYDGVEWAVTDNIRRFKKFVDDAKAEKEVDEDLNKQFILQHKDTNISTNRGFVNIQTTKNDYKKDIKQISTSATADYVFNKRNIKNKFFQDVVLSQDGIDNFLKADDDKMRFDKFFTNFGDLKLENYHKNIEILEKKNYQEKNQLEQKIDEINKLLNEPVDDNIYKSTNEKINQINENNDTQFDLIDESFNEVKKSEFETKLLQQQRNLIESIETNKLFISKLPSWLENSEKYFKHKIDWESKKNKLKDFEDLKKANSKIYFLKEEIKKDNLKKV